MSIATRKNKNSKMLREVQRFQHSRKNKPDFKKGRSWQFHNIVIWAYRIIGQKIDMESGIVHKGKETKQQLSKIRYFGTFSPIRHDKYLITRGKGK